MTIRLLKSTWQILHKMESPRQHPLFQLWHSSSTELTLCGLDFPVPRILDSIVVGGQTFTLTRVYGELLIDGIEALSDVQLETIE